MRVAATRSIMVLVLVGLSACALEASTPTAPEVAKDICGDPFSERFHIVGVKDNLWAIALRYGLSVREIKQANGLGDPDRIPVGTRIRIPPDPLAVARANLRKNSALREPRSSPAGGGDEPDVGAAPDTEEEVPTALGANRRSRSLALRCSEAPFVWPVAGKVMSRYGKRRGRTHKGIDIKASKGTPIRAALSGVVVFSGTIRGHGRVVVIDHENGFHTVYSHNQSNLVTSDDEGARTVKTGQVIATVGRSGNATTSHLHFEIRKNEAPVNPSTLLGAEPVRTIARGEDDDSSI